MPFDKKRTEELADRSTSYFLHRMDATQLEILVDALSQQMLVIDVGSYVFNQMKLS